MSENETTAKLPINKEDLNNAVEKAVSERWKREKERIEQEVDKSKSQKKFEQVLRETAERTEKKLSKYIILFAAGIIIAIVGSFITTTYKARKEVYEGVISLQKDIIDAQAVIQNSTQELRRVEEELSRARTNLKTSNDEIDRAVSKLKDTKKNFETAVKDMEERMDKLEVRIKPLEK